MYGRVIILGLDPGTRRTGYGAIEIMGDAKPVIHAAGVIRLGEGLSLSARLSLLAAELQKIFVRVQPNITVVEKIFFGKNADSAFKLGHARGVCLMSAAQHNSKVEEYAARVVKKVVTGTGSASKEHVRWIVTRMLNYYPESTDMDVSDALALAVCHQRSMEVRGINDRLSARPAP